VQLGLLDLASVHVSGDGSTDAAKGSEMTDFREQFVDRIGPDQDSYSAPPRPGLVKVFRSAGCWVYRVAPDQEKEFCQWVRDHLGLPELGRVRITGEFPMLRVFSPFDDLIA
jgi:hypothetical protein